MKCVSETYKYRARASPYNKMPSTVDWVLEEESAPSAQASNTDTDRLLASFLEPFLERPFADVVSLDRRRSR